jgi:hypothetical protein
VAPTSTFQVPTSRLRRVRESAPCRLRGGMTTARLRALALVAPALTLAACTSSEVVSADLTTKPLSIVNIASAPKGWIAVAFGDAQIAVPSTWWVYYNSPPCPTGSPPGEVFVDPPPGVFHCPAETAPGPSTTVSLESPRSPRSAVLGYPAVVNGLSVYPYPAGPRHSYLVPALDLELTVDGPLAQKALHTLMRSPRSVLLASGPVAAVPSSWQSVSFAGLVFSAPADWPVTSTAIVNVPGNPCRTLGIALSATQVSLSTDTRPFVRDFMCARLSPTPYQPDDGVQVDSGSRSALIVTLSFSSHCLKFHGLIACPASSPAYDVAFLRVTLPGRPKPVFVSIGLAGNGMVARTILYSINKA